MTKIKDLKRSVKEKEAQIQYLNQKITDLLDQASKRATTTTFKQDETTAIFNNNHR